VQQDLLRAHCEDFFEIGRLWRQAFSAERYPTFHGQCLHPDDAPDNWEHAAAKGEAAVEPYVQYSFAQLRKRKQPFVPASPAPTADDFLYEGDDPEALLALVSLAAQALLWHLASQQGEVKPWTGP
jgi:hypothetical protein